MTSTSKTQIDQLGDCLRKGRVSDEDLRRLDAYRGSFAAAYEQVVAAIREGTQLEPTGRPAKSTSSIIEKLRRETIRLSQMQDIAGCRLVVEDILAQDQVVERLKATLAMTAVIDRRKQPSYGYRAIHIIATARGRPIEIQVRTELQHLWAQLSEVLADLLDPSIKYGGGDSKTKEVLSSFSEMVGVLELGQRLLAQAVTHAPETKARELRRQIQELAHEGVLLKAQVQALLEEFIKRSARGEWAP